MPFYFVGSLESGNVCEHFIMKQYFNSLGIIQHDVALTIWALKKKSMKYIFYRK